MELFSNSRVGVAVPQKHTKHTDSASQIEMCEQEE